MAYIEKDDGFELLENVFGTARRYCRNQMSAPTYNTFAEGIKDVIFGLPNRITLAFQDNVNSDVILNSYAPILKEAFRSTHDIQVFLRFAISDGESVIENLNDLPIHDDATSGSKNGSTTAKALNSIDDLNNALDVAKQYFRERSQEATYDYYISDIKAVGFETASTITLQIRSPFIREIVADRYSGLLKEGFCSTLGGNVDLKFVVASENDANN